VSGTETIVLAATPKSNKKVKEPTQTLDSRTHKYTKQDPIKMRGIKLGGFGRRKMGKSMSFGLLGFFNDEYKPIMEQKGYTGCVKLLSKGILPQIEKIIIGDTEIVWNERILNYPYLKRYFVPLLPKIDAIDLHGLDPDKGQSMSFEETKLLVEDFVGKIMDGGENVLGIMDSFSTYKMALDQDLFNLHGKEFLHTKLKSGEGADDNIMQIHYGWVNVVWEMIMTTMRDCKGWFGSTFKMGEMTDETYESVKKKNAAAGKAPSQKESIKWVKGTDFFVDVCFKFFDRWEFAEGQNKQIINCKYEYGSIRPAMIEFPLPDNSAAGLMMLEQLAPCLLDDTGILEGKGVW
jgi:hypothetical protein